MAAKIWDQFKGILSKEKNETVFSKILEQGRVRNMMPSLQQASMNWYQTAAKGMVVDPNQVLRADKSRLVTSRELRIGNMYLFSYDPKTKKDLPYYDIFPLVIPFDSKTVQNIVARTPNGIGFMGLNFHYLQPQLRAVLLGQLAQISRVTQLDETARIRASYSMMKNASRMKYFKPCVKQYLLSHVNSGRFYYITPEEWLPALFLNLAKFQGASQSAVWKESLTKV
jgi:hypothetical protein